jgi:hypothetical protein
LSLTISSEIGDLVGQSYALQGTGVARVRQAEFKKARDVLQSALDLAVTSRERLAEARALLGLGELALASGDPGQAVVFGKDASDMFRGIGAVLYDARALTLLSDAHAALGDGAAVVSAETAALARQAARRHVGLSPEALVRHRADDVTLAGMLTAPAGHPRSRVHAAGSEIGRGGTVAATAGCTRAACAVGRDLAPLCLVSA